MPVITPQLYPNRSAEPTARGWAPRPLPQVLQAPRPRIPWPEPLWGTVSGSSATSTTYAVPVPPGIKAGDWVDVVYSANSTVADTVTPPAGWSTLLASTFRNSYACAWFSYIVTAADEASPPASWTFTISTARAANFNVRHIRGIDPVTPLNTAVVSGSSATSTTTVTGPTTTAPGTLLVGFGDLQSATTQSISNPKGWAGNSSTCGLNLARGTVTGQTFVPNAGATGTLTWTKTSALAGVSAAVALNVMPAVADRNVLVVPWGTPPPVRPTITVLARSTADPVVVPGTPPRLVAPPVPLALASDGEPPQPAGSH